MQIVRKFTVARVATHIRIRFAQVAKVNVFDALFSTEHYFVLLDFVHHALLLARQLLHPVLQRRDLFIGVHRRVVSQVGIILNVDVIEVLPILV